MSKIYNLVGKQFGELIVLEKIYINNKLKWRCKCSCGNNDYYAYSDELNSGRKTMCNKCGNTNAHIKHRKSHIGEKHGYLTIIDEIYNYNNTAKRFIYVIVNVAKQILLKIVHINGMKIHRVVVKPKKIFLKKLVGILMVKNLVNY